MTEIVATEGVLDGTPRIEGRRIGVHHVAKRIIDAGESPEQVAADYDLDIVDVYRALVYYYDHPEEMRRIQTQRQSTPDDLTVICGPEDLDTETRSEPEA